jgi:hypothetical protein
MRIDLITFGFGFEIQKLLALEAHGGVYYSKTIEDHIAIRILL